MERTKCCGVSLELVANKYFGHSARCPGRCRICRKHLPSEPHTSGCPDRPGAELERVDDEITGGIIYGTPERRAQ